MLNPDRPPINVTRVCHINYYSRIPLSRKLTLMFESSGDWELYIKRCNSNSGIITRQAFEQREFVYDYEDATPTNPRNLTLYEILNFLNVAPFDEKKKEFVRDIGFYGLPLQFYNCNVLRRTGNDGFLTAEVAGAFYAFRYYTS